MATLLTATVLAFGVPTTSTAYCLHGTMADGSYTRAGSIAHNGYPLGTRVTVWPSPTGARHFVVRDRIGWGTQLDFWLPSCSAALAWGRRVVHVRLGWRNACSWQTAHCGRSSPPHRCPSWPASAWASCCRVVTASCVATVITRSAHRLLLPRLPRARHQP